ncbi:hypothetical protein C8J56DRAFT_1047882 [Mycena floridula]|nr:hypothetical protein C8J56DRAFT_1047882 [Mycena floridula]
MKFLSASFLVAVVAATSVSAGFFPRSGVDGQITVNIVPGLTLAEFCLEFTGACLATAAIQAEDQEPTAFCVQGPVATQANILCSAPQTPLFTGNIAGTLFTVHKTTLP